MPASKIPERNLTSVHLHLSFFFRKLKIFLAVFSKWFACLYLNFSKLQPHLQGQGLHASNFWLRWFHLHHNSQILFCPPTVFFFSLVFSFFNSSGKLPIFRFFHSKQSPAYCQNCKVYSVNMNFLRVILPLLWPNSMSQCKTHYSSCWLCKHWFSNSCMWKYTYENVTILWRRGMLWNSSLVQWLTDNNLGFVCSPAANGKARLITSVIMPRQLLLKPLMDIKCSWASYFCTRSASEGGEKIS